LNGYVLNFSQRQLLLNHPHPALRPKNPLRKSVRYLKFHLADWMPTVFYGSKKLARTGFKPNGFCGDKKI